MLLVARLPVWGGPRRQNSRWLVPSPEAEEVASKAVDVGGRKEAEGPLNLRACPRAGSLCQGTETALPRGASPWRNWGPLDICRHSACAAQAGAHGTAPQQDCTPAGPTHTVPGCPGCPSCTPRCLGQYCRVRHSSLQLRISRGFSLLHQGLPGRDGVPGSPGERGKDVSTSGG